MSAEANAAAGAAPSTVDEPVDLLRSAMVSVGLNNAYSPIVETVTSDSSFQSTRPLVSSHWTPRWSACSRCWSSSMGSHQYHCFRTARVVNPERGRSSMRATAMVQTVTSEPSHAIILLPSVDLNSARLVAPERDRSPKVMELMMATKKALPHPTCHRSPLMSTTAPLPTVGRHF